MKKSTFAIIIAAVIILTVGILANKLNPRLLTGRLDPDEISSLWGEAIQDITINTADDPRDRTAGIDNIDKLQQFGTLRDAIIAADESIFFDSSKYLRIKFNLPAGRGDGKGGVFPNKITLTRPIEIRNSKVKGIIIDGGANKTTITCTPIGNGLPSNYPAFILTPKNSVINRSENNGEQIKQNVPQNIYLQDLTIKECGQALKVENKTEIVQNQTIETNGFEGKLILQYNEIIGNGSQDNLKAAITLKPQANISNQLQSHTLYGSGTILIEGNTFRGNIGGGIDLSDTSLGNSFNYPIYIAENSFEMNGWIVNDTNPYQEEDDDEMERENTSGIIIKNTAIEDINCTQGRECREEDRVRNNQGGFEIYDNKFITNVGYGIFISNTRGAPGIYYTTPGDIQILSTPTNFQPDLQNLKNNKQFIKFKFDNRYPGTSELSEHLKISRPPITLWPITFNNNILRWSFSIPLERNEIAAEYNNDLGFKFTILQGNTPTNFTKFLGETPPNDERSNGEYNINLNPLDGNYIGVIASVKNENDGHTLSSNLYSYQITETKIKEISICPISGECQERLMDKFTFPGVIDGQIRLSYEIYSQDLKSIREKPDSIKVLINADPIEGYHYGFKVRQTNEQTYEVEHEESVPINNEGQPLYNQAKALQGILEPANPEWLGGENGWTQWTASRLLPPSHFRIGTIQMDENGEIILDSVRSYKYEAVVQRINNTDDTVVEEKKIEIEIRPGVNPDNIMSYFVNEENEKVNTLKVDPVESNNTLIIRSKSLQELERCGAEMGEQEKLIFKFDILDDSKYAQSFYKLIAQQKSNPVNRMTFLSGKRGEGTQTVEWCGVYANHIAPVGIYDLWVERYNYENGTKIEETAKIPFEILAVGENDEIVGESGVIPDGEEGAQEEEGSEEDEGFQFGDIGKILGLLEGQDESEQPGEEGEERNIEFNKDILDFMNNREGMPVFTYIKADNQEVDMDRFTVSFDSRRNPLQVQYKVSQASKVSVEVLDANKNPLDPQHLLMNNVDNRANQINTVTWDGADKRLNPLPDGRYHLKFLAVNSNDQTGTAYLTVNLVGRGAYIQNLEAIPSQIEPYGTKLDEGVLDYTNLTFTLNAALDAKVSIVELDKRDMPTMSYILRDREGFDNGENHVVWCGELNNEETLFASSDQRNKKYVFKVEAWQPQALEVLEAKTSPVITIIPCEGANCETGGVANAGGVIPPAITASLRPYRFNPDIVESLEIKYLLNQDAQVTTEILDSHNETVKIIEQLEPRLAYSGLAEARVQNQFIIFWDGKDEQLKKAMPGNYKVRISANGSTAQLGFSVERSPLSCEEGFVAEGQLGDQTCVRHCEKGFALISRECVRSECTSGFRLTETHTCEKVCPATYLVNGDQCVCPLRAVERTEEGQKICVCPTGCEYRDNVCYIIPQAVKITHTVTKSKFNPRKEESTTIRFSIDQKVSRLVVNLYKEGEEMPNQTLFFKENEATAAGTYEILWDGQILDEDGELVTGEEGLYTYIIQARNDNGMSSAQGNIEISYGAESCETFFADVTEDDEDCARFTLAYKLGIFYGAKNPEEGERNLLKPDEVLKRTEFFAIANRVANVPNLQYDPASDGNMGHFDLDPYVGDPGALWFLTEIKKGKAYGIIGGYKDGSMKPLTEIRAAELWKVTIESLLVSSRAKFSLRANIGKDPWYTDYENFLKDNNIISRTFQPAYVMTRRDAVRFIANLYAAGLFE